MEHKPAVLERHAFEPALGDDFLELLKASREFGEYSEIVSYSSAMPIFESDAKVPDKFHPVVGLVVYPGR